MGGGVNVKGRQERGQSFADFAFSKGNNSRTLMDGEHGGIWREGNTGSHGGNCSQRAEWRGTKGRDLNSGKLGLLLKGF